MEFRRDHHYPRLRDHYGRDRWQKDMKQRLRTTRANNVFNRTALIDSVRLC